MESIRALLWKPYWAIEQRVVPGLRYSMDQFETLVTPRFRDGIQWLDVGCGHGLLPSYRREQELALIGKVGRAVGIDLDLHSLKKNSMLTQLAMADAGALPFPDATFDLVTANMVVEHLEHPEAVFCELERVLNPEGLFIFHTPNAHALSVRFARLVPDRVMRPVVGFIEGRAQDDIFPTHYAANTRAAIAELAQRNNFEVVSVDFILTTAVFAPLFPLALVELLYIRWLGQDRHKDLRPNIIATLKKKSTPALD